MLTRRDNHGIRLRGTNSQAGNGLIRRSGRLRTVQQHIWRSRNRKRTGAATLTQNEPARLLLPPQNKPRNLHLQVDYLLALSYQQHPSPCDHCSPLGRQGSTRPHHHRSNSIPGDSHRLPNRHRPPRATQLPRWTFLHLLPAPPYGSPSSKRRNASLTPLLGTQHGSIILHMASANNGTPRASTAPTGRRTWSSGRSIIKGHSPSTSTQSLIRHAQHPPHPQH